MRLFYNENYFEEYGEKYDSISDNDFLTLRDFLPEIRPNSRILELGCGSCSFGERVQGITSVSSLVGVDICLSALQWSSATCCQGDAAQLPFHDKVFNSILVAAAFHHFPDISRTLAESYRCLSAGGSLFAFEPNMFHPHRLICMTDPLRRYFYKTGDHCISPLWMKRRMKELGFKNIKIGFIALEGHHVNFMARCNLALIKIVGMKLPVLYPVVAPWFVISGNKP